MKTNITLQSLNLGCEQEKREEGGRIADIADNKHKQAGNNIGAEGARALSDALKTNTTLQSLNMDCEQEKRWKMDELQTLPTTNTNKQTTGLVFKEHKH